MKKLLLAVTFIGASAVSIYAQPIEPPLIPIDGGVGYLIAAGLIIGIKKLLGNKKSNRF
jgi:hypothetical protein